MNINCTVAQVEFCPKCLSRNIVYKAIAYPPNNIQVRVLCRDCDNSYALPHLENLERRINTTLAHWRANVARRDQYKCVICGSSDSLEVHHIIPVFADSQREYMYEESNGITLCHKHHMMAHNREP